jgi:hypothetical protein
MSIIYIAGYVVKDIADAELERLWTTLEGGEISECKISFFIEDEEQAVWLNLRIGSGIEVSENSL